jgi:chemotaxis signal transduction protein/nucleoid-associated protein YgaU
LETAHRTEQHPSADRGRAPPRCWLVFRVGGCLLCASALDVEGIIPRPEGFAKLPLMPDYALGAFLFRGRSAAAISLRRKLKLRQGEDSSSGPFVVAQVGDALVAFWVDEVSDVIEEKDADWRPLPEMLPGGLFERLGICGDQIILQTCFAALLEADVESRSLVALADARADAPPVEPVVVAPVATAPARQAPAPEVAPTSARIAPIVAPRPKREPEMRRRRHVDRPALRPVPRARTAMPSVVIAPPSPAPSKDMPSAVVHRQKASPMRYAFAAAAVVASLAATALLHEVQPGPAPEPRPVAVAAASPVVSLPAPVEVTAPAPPPPARIVTPVPAQSIAPAPVARVHVVIPGDTLWDIAKTYAGDPLQYPALAKVSSISNPHLIRPGDVVRVETAQREQTGLAR